MTFYIYVISERGQLIGVVSFKQLLFSKKSQFLKDIMNPEAVSVTIDTHQEHIFGALADLFAIAILFGLFNRVMG